MPLSCIFVLQLFLNLSKHGVQRVIYLFHKNLSINAFKKYFPARDLADFENICLAISVYGIIHGSKGDGAPIANGFLPPLFSKDFFVILENKGI